MFLRLAASTVMLMLLLAFTSCGGTPHSEQSPHRNLEPWQVQLTLTGGFRGLHREIRVDSEAVDLKITEAPKPEVGRELPVSDKTELAQLLATLPTRDVEALNPHCRDCVSFELRVWSTSGVHTASYDSSTLGGSVHEAIITRLARLGEPEPLDSHPNK
ncbi:MAG: hypothetical protein ABW034_07505 [Steroidobacteraceae bacterium]